MPFIGEPGAEGTGVVKKLLEAEVESNLRCIDLKATPLVWVIHGYRFGGPDNQHCQVKCVSHLLDAGADPDLRNGEGLSPLDKLDAGDQELGNMLTGK